MHADASNFAAGVGKGEAYKQVIHQAEALFEGQRNWVWCVLNLYSDTATTRTKGARRSNTANTASLLWHAYHALPSPSNQVNWAGFYVLDPSANEQLILGPFHGKVTEIPDPQLPTIPVLMADADT